MDSGQLIDALGGTNHVARLTEVSPPSVSEWRRNGVIPLDKLLYLAVVAEERGVATRQALLPGVWKKYWPELAKKEKRRAAREAA